MERYWLGLYIVGYRVEAAGVFARVGRHPDLEESTCQTKVTHGPVQSSASVETFRSVYAPKSWGRKAASHLRRPVREYSPPASTPRASQHPSAGSLASMSAARRGQRRHPSHPGPRSVQNLRGFGVHDSGSRTRDCVRAYKICDKHSL